MTGVCLYLIVDLDDLHEDAERQRHQHITDEGPSVAEVLVQRDGRDVPLPVILLHIHCTHIHPFERVTRHMHTSPDPTLTLELAFIRTGVCLRRRSFRKRLGRIGSSEQMSVNQVPQEGVNHAQAGHLGQETHGAAESWN